ncbi:MAG: type II toxin-antitoxin system HicB family antitoxin [Jiangellaceae bacterium]
MTRTIHARVQRSGRYWAVYVPEVDRWTQARHLREVDPMARDLAALMLDVEADTLRIDITIATPAAAAELRAAARELYDAGLTLRDIGKVLDVSYQRAHQLLSTTTGTAPTAARKTPARKVAAKKAS